MKKAKLFHKSVLTVCIALLLALGCAAALSPLPMGTVSAAEVKTSALWKTSDGIKYEGTDDGSKLSITSSKEKGDISFKNSLYMKNSAVKNGADDFSVTFTVTSAEFTKLTVTLLSTHHNTTITDKLENKIDIVNKDGKIAVNFKDGSDTDYDVKDEDLAPVGDAAFSGAKVTITYSAANKTISVAVNGSAAPRTKVLKNAIEGDEAQLRFTFNGVTQVETTETAKTASIAVSEVNGQSLAAPSNGAITDANPPFIIVDENKFSSSRTVSGETVYKIGVNSDNNLPVRVFSVVQQNLKSKVEAWYSAADLTFTGDAGFTEEGTSHFAAFKKNAGYYKVNYSVPITDGSDDRITKTFYFETVADTSAPQIDLSTYEADNDQYFERSAARAGKEYQLPAPSVTDNVGVDNQYNVQWTLWYRTPSGTVWTKADGLKFTPSAVGVYLIRFQARDSSGNVSKATDADKALSINFIDRDAPTLTVTSFPEKGYPGEELRLPSGSASDTVDSAPVKTLKVYYLGQDGTAEREEIEITSNRFTPSEDKMGKYVAVYTAKDAANNETTLEKFFSVVADDREPTKPVFDFWTPWTITFVCIGSAALMGIVVLLFVKPKKAAK